MLNVPWFKTLLMQLSLLLFKVSHIVIDEAHCVETWGTGASPFRSAFGEIRTLRSLVPTAKLVALTATAAPATQKCIKQTLLLGTTFPMHIIQSDPDRTGLYMCVETRLASTGKHSVKESYEKVLMPLLTELEEDPGSFPKTVVYMALGWCGQAHRLALEVLPANLQIKVAQYHSPQTAHMKELIPPGMEEGEFLLVFATEALGMGADIKDIRRVMHIRPPSSLETYMQEIGRAGRDGNGGVATMFVNAADLSGKHVKEEMKEFCRATGCRRELLLKHFGSTIQDPSAPHACCDNCRATCMCHACQEQKVDEVKEPTISFSKTDREHRQLMLEAYFQSENDLCRDCLFPEAVTGLSSSLAKNIVQHYPKSRQLETICAAYPHIKRDYLHNIVLIMEQLSQ